MIIPASFLILVALMLWLVIFARGHWTLKLALIVFVPLFCFAVWSALGSYKGYPVSATLPPKAVVVSDIVIEPGYDDSGKIYLWLIPVDPQKSMIGYDPRNGEPRAYVVPYSRPLHEQLEGLRGKQGTPVLEKTSPGRKGRGKDGPRSKFHAYVLPPALPTKGG